MCPEVRPQRRYKDASPQPPGPGGKTETPRTSRDGPKSAPEKFESQQPGAVARAPSQVPTTGSQLGRGTMPAIPPPKHSHFLKVSSDSGSPRELGTSCQVLPKLPFTRTKGEPNSRGLNGKHQRQPPSVDTTSANKRNRTHRCPDSGAPLTHPASVLDGKAAPQECSQPSLPATLQGARLRSPKPPPPVLGRRCLHPLPWSGEKTSSCPGAW